MSYLKDELKGFVPVAQATEIIKNATRGSSILRLSKVENLETETKKFPVMVDGAGAYWVGEGERIKTSGATWIYPEIRAKKLAVIIPVTREKLDDTTINVFSELQESIAEAFATTLDKACFFGINSPFSTSLMGGINEKGHTLTANASSIDLSASDTMAIVEEAGFEINGFASHIGLKNTLRKLRDASGAPIFISGVGENELYGHPIEFVRNSAWDKKQADFICGDWKYSIIGIRDNIEFEILKEATLLGSFSTDGTPLSLAEQDMIAIKATMRIGYLCVKPDAFAAMLSPEPVIPDCTLSSLTIGNCTLDPVFDKNTTSYVTSTINNSNKITVTATDDTNAVIAIDVNGGAVENGESATWTTGANTVTVTVTNQTIKKIYYVTVNKE